MVRLNDGIIEQKTFPDNTPIIHLPLLLQDIGTQVITWNYEDMSELFLVYCIAKQIMETTINKVALEMGYCPNARQDRTQSGRDVFTLKWFCEIINSINFEWVEIMDIHSNVAPALINHCVSQTNADLFNKVTKKENIDLVFYPDNGAYSKYSKYIEYPSVFAIKNRDWGTGRITGLEVVGDVKDKNILFVDDIISYGGSLMFSALKLKELGAKNIYALITHTENSFLDEENGKANKILGNIVEKLYTTNSIFTKTHPLIETIF